MQHFLMKREQEHSFLSQRKTCKVRELTAVELFILSLNVCGCAFVVSVCFLFHNVHIMFT